MGIIRVERSGKDLILVDSNGSRRTAYAGIAGLWYAKDDANQAGGGGGTSAGGWRMKDPISSYTGPHWTGEIVTYNATQCKHAWEIIRTCIAIPGIEKDMIIATLMCALVESVLRMYANENVPESLNYPHDAVGSDHDSVGLFQQRPSIPWGTVGQLMSYDYSCRAFIGGPQGPNRGSPPGLLDISPAWNTLPTLGEAVQDVQVSAHPSRYNNVESTARGMFDAMCEPAPTGSGAGGVIDPLPGHYDASDPFGSYAGGRLNPHRGSDWNGVPEGTPLPALTAGTVTATGYGGVVGNYTTVKMASHPLYYAYIHQVRPPSIAVGTAVATGDIIGHLGNTGSASFGAHLHVSMGDNPETHFGYPNLIDPYAWIKANGG